MENALHIAAVWAHILGVALYVGPQAFLAFAWIPASRGIADRATRARAMRTVTERFGYISAVGLGLILIAGTYLISTWRDYHGIPEDASFVDYRYGVLFIIKMSILVVMLAVVGLHTFWVGRKQLELHEELARGEDVTEGELRSTRRLSVFLSTLGLILTLVIMVLGASMSSAEFSLQPS